MAKQKYRVIGCCVIDSLLKPDKSFVSAFSVKERHIDIEQAEERICHILFRGDFPMSYQGQFLGNAKETSRLFIDKNIRID